MKKQAIIENQVKRYAIDKKENGSHLGLSKLNRL